MECSPTFSIHDLGGYSQEHESTHSTHCISNFTKMALFSFWIAAFSCALLLVIAALIMDLKKTKKWNPQKRSFIALILTAVAQLIRFSLYLAGVNHRGLYVIFFISESVTFSNFFLFIRDCFKATSMIHHPGEMRVGKVLRQFDIYLVVGIFYATLGFFICKTLGPMIFFDKPQILNWFYLFSFTHYGCLAFGGYAFFSFFSGKLRAAIVPALEFNQSSHKLRRFIEKLDQFTALYRNGLPGNIFLLLTPVWMGVSSTPSNPLGMANFFYVDICFWTTVQFFCIVFFTWFMEKRYYEIRGSSEEKGNSNSISTSQPRSRSHEDKLSSKPSTKDHEKDAEGSVTATFPVIPINELASLPEH